MIFGQLIDTSELGGNGPAWALVGILLTICWFLIKMLLNEKDKRIEDATKYQDNLAAPIKEFGETIQRMEQKIKIAKGE